MTAAGADPILMVEHLTMRFGGLVAVNDLSFTARAGAITALIGPNGAGKTSALLALAGLVPHRGTISWQGRPLAGLGAGERARLLAVVVQEPVLPAELTVAEYVLLGRRPHLPYLGRESRADRALVAEVLARLDLRALAGRALGTLSGGERQRAVLARALAQQPRVLLLDEPTSALDLGRQQQALELLDQLRRESGLTVVTALHDLTLAGQFADSLVLLRGGHTLASGRPPEVLTESALALAYDARVRVVVQPDGSRAVVPIRLPAGAADAAGDGAGNAAGNAAAVAGAGREVG